MTADLRPVLMQLVPRAWSAKQALRAVELLQHAIDAIWCVHGEAMSRARLGEITAQPPSEPAAPPVEPPKKPTEPTRQPESRRRTP